MKNPVDGFSVGLADDNNIYEWHCMMEGPPDSDYEGGYFPCSLSFPKEYPNKPPVMRFLTQGFWHPNVYKSHSTAQHSTAQHSTAQHSNTQRHSAHA